MPKWIQVGKETLGSKAGSKTHRVTITLPEEIATGLVRESIDRSTTVSGLVREAVAEYLARRDPKGLPRFVGMADHPDPTLSERVEEIIAEDAQADDPHTG